MRWSSAFGAGRAANTFKT